MKTCGIIAEFNPFHNGHAKLFEYAKDTIGADYIIVVMSGEHVQRGGPAVCDKYLRTGAALMAGADLVLELPVFSSLSNAAVFAKGAVAALLNTGVTDVLLFGSETGDIRELQNRANEDTSFIKDYSGRPSPNDSLATEYLRALSFFNSDISAVTLKREGAAYNDLKPDKDSASAACIRGFLKSSSEEAFNFMPAFSKELLCSYISSSRLMDISVYSEKLRYALALKDRNELCAYAGIYPDLADKIIKKLNSYTDFSGFIDSLKSKDLTYTYISRALLHILLDIREECLDIFSNDFSFCPYLRILGIKKEAAELLHSFGSNASVPVISRLGEAKKLLDASGYDLLMHEIRAADIYHMTSARTLPFTSEYSRFLIRM